METWFFNHVLGLSLSVLLLGLPGPLGAGTPGYNNSDPVTAGFYHSSATDGLSNMENNETSSSYSSESLSATQRDLLLSHGAEIHTATVGHSDTEQTQTFTETSSGSPETRDLSTKPFNSTRGAFISQVSSSSSSSSSSSGSSISSNVSSSSMTSSSSSMTSSSSITSSSSMSSSMSSSSSKDWKDVVNTDQVPDVSTAVFRETRSSTSKEVRLSQDSPDSALRQGDATAFASQTAVHTNSTYTSTTFTRAGERNLLSVTSSSNNNASSAFTDDSHSTWPVSDKATETEDYTHSAPSTRTDSGDTTDQHATHSVSGMFPQTGNPGVSRGTQNLTGSPHATQHQQTTMSEETSYSTPSLRVTELSSDRTETLVSSTPPVTLSARGPANMSGTDPESGSNVGTSTEFSTAGHSSSTLNEESTEQLSSQTREETVGLGLTTVSPTVRINTSEMDSLTNLPVQVTDAFLTTTSVPITERSQITEEDTFKATVSTTPTPPLAATSSSGFTSTTSSSVTESHTKASTPYTTPSTTASTSVPQISPVHPTHHVSPNQTQGPSTGIINPTDVTTLQKETSTGTLGVTTSHNQYVTTTYTRSAPTRSTDFLYTTEKQTDRETTVSVVTTPPSDIQPTKAPLPPRNPCVSNPCMNGGMCVSYKGHQFTCQCQQGWTGPTCEQDMDECESKPCPLGSRCVNTRGSFSCECPLGFDLEDGRTCTRAKTFLGTFSVNRQPHDPAIFKSATMHEIQREIIQLLNASLSVLHGYSRSMLSKREEDGVSISAVNMFSISADVTSPEVYRSIQMSLSNCSPSLAHCRMVLHYKLTYHVESLCVAQKTQCNPERSNCTDISGTAYCQCLPGYYKHHPDESACLECGDGYKLENGTCVPCMFGFGGFNCGNFYKLIAVVVAPTGGALLLVLIIALIVTCCKRDKNDINKIIFKSGDLQMSPYADFPKNNRISMEWGRETIEMQENGSTKNLLQMTDIYYSPALRNADLERNGLYPFTGLPGSRHSCIYPAQWNPSFISDDSRRRDYF